MEQLIKQETDLQIENILTGMHHTLSNLANNPGQAEFQIQIAQLVIDLDTATNQLRAEHNPIFRRYLMEIGALPYFSKMMYNQITTMIATNAMTPAVALQNLSNFKSERSNFIQQLNNMQSAMQQLNFGEEEIESGEAQVGFRIPRELFNNELEGWISELRELRRFVRAFSELATGAAERIKIGQISTTDPLIFFALAAPTVAAIGKAVSWSLDQWKKVEDIRKVRAETAKINETLGGQMDDLISQFDERITASVNAAIEQHAHELVKPGAEPGRVQEQLQDIIFALHGLVARIERGMTIELKYLPPSAETLERNPAEATAFADLNEIVSQLYFPERSHSPVISLPRQSRDATAEVGNI
ncbi:MAG: hypothetical protein WCO11_03055 [Sphingomonadales bacterium]